MLIACSFRAECLNGINYKAIPPQWINYVVVVQVSERSVIQLGLFEALNREVELNGIKKGVPPCIPGSFFPVPGFNMQWPIFVPPGLPTPSEDQNPCRRFRKWSVGLKLKLKNRWERISISSPCLLILRYRGRDHLYHLCDSRRPLLVHCSPVIWIYWRAAASNISFSDAKPFNVPEGAPVVPKFISVWRNKKNLGYVGWLERRC